MKLLKDGKPVTDDWVHLDDADPAPAAGGGIVSLDRWQAERDALLKRGQVGIRLKSNEAPAEIRDDLGHFGVIALEFPVYRDGRAFSYARLLRERFGYKGELRAVGNVLFDQLAFMHRCGFDAFEVQKDPDADRFAKALTAFSVRYQRAADDAQTALELRHKARRNVAQEGR
ncbi:MAG TPA: oxidoreductase [Alphaproteobacteria bacterium]|nr:oxidoreductase [Alphaproteobacteria bacterium]